MFLMADVRFTQMLFRKIEERQNLAQTKYWTLFVKILLLYEYDKRKAHL